MHVQIQREGGGGVGGPDPIPGKSQVLSNSIEISIWTPLVNSWTPPRIPGKFWTKKKPKQTYKNQSCFLAVGLGPPPPLRDKKIWICACIDHSTAHPPPPPGLIQCQKELYGYVCTLAELSTNHRGPPGGGGEAEINLLVPLKSKICFPGFHVPQHFLCLLVPLKSCTYLLCSLEINAPLPCFQKPMEGLTNY